MNLVKKKIVGRNSLVTCQNNNNRNSPQSYDIISLSISSHGFVLDFSKRSPTNGVIFFAYKFMIITQISGCRTSMGMGITHPCVFLEEIVVDTSPCWPINTPKNVTNCVCKSLLLNKNHSHGFQCIRQRHSG